MAAAESSGTNTPLLRSASVLTSACVDVSLCAYTARLSASGPAVPASMAARASLARSTVE